MDLTRYLQMTPPAGWLHMARLALKGVRFAPSSRILGRASGIVLARGSKIGPSVTFDVAEGGQISIGPSCWFHSDVEIRTSGRVSIGRGTTIQKGVILNGNVDIGASCIFAPRVFVSSGTHVFDWNPSLPIRLQEELLERSCSGQEEISQKVDRPVLIDDDCWLGANCVLMPGIHLGRGAIVGANAVVTRDVLPYQVFGGAPAKLIKKRLDWSPALPLDATSVESIPYLCRGFGLSVSGPEVTATLSGRATLALPLTADNAIRITIQANGPGRLSIGSELLVYAAGRQTLKFSRWRDVAEIWAGACSVEIHVSDDSSLPVRLIAVQDG